MDVTLGLLYSIYNSKNLTRYRENIARYCFFFENFYYNCIYWEVFIVLTFCIFMHLYALCIFMPWFWLRLSRYYFSNCRSHPWSNGNDFAKKYMNSNGIENSSKHVFRFRNGREHTMKLRSFAECVCKNVNPICICCL